MAVAPAPAQADEVVPAIALPAPRPHVHQASQAAADGGQQLTGRRDRQRGGERVVLPLQTLSNLLAALGEGDFSIRARGARGGDPLGEVMIEVEDTGVVSVRWRTGALGSAVAETLCEIAPRRLLRIGLPDRFVDVVGTPEQILKEPANDYVATFTQDVDASRVFTAEMVMQKPDTVVSSRAGPRVALHKMRELGLSSVVAALLVQRGLAEPQAAERFLRSSLRELPDPQQLPD